MCRIRSDPGILTGSGVKDKTKIGPGFIILINILGIEIFFYSIGPKSYFKSYEDKAFKNLRSGSLNGRIQMRSVSDLIQVFESAQGSRKKVIFFFKWSHHLEGGGGKDRTTKKK